MLISFFPLLSQKIESRGRPYIFELQNEAQQSTTKIQTARDYSSATAIVLMVFWTDFCIISDYRNSFNNKFKDFEQAKNCFDPAKTHP